MGTMTRYVIDRSTWRNANHGVGTTALLNSQGHRCCLGQIAKQCLVPDRDCLNVGAPDGVLLSSRSNSFSDLLLNDLGNDNALAMEAMEINDDYELTDAEREENLTLLFKQHGVTLEFVGNFP